MGQNHRHQTTEFTAVLYGQQPALEQLGKSALAQAQNLGANKGAVHRLLLPSGSADTGFQTIVQPRSTTNQLINADGILLTQPGSAVVMQTRDCPVVVLYNPKNGRLVVFHAGRPALTPQLECSACEYTVISAAQRVVAPDSDMTAVRAYITGSICGTCFVHDQPGGEDHIRYFDRFGESVFINRHTGALSLITVLRLMLIRRGMSADNIYHDGLCTKETSWLASKRGQKDGYNTVIVVRHT